jgi:hypothetical protein
MRKTVLLGALTLVLGISCGRGPVLSTPRNQAGTRSVVLPDDAAAQAAEVSADANGTAAFAPELPGKQEEARGGKRAVPKKIDLEIREKLFIAQTNDVYLNPEDYIGKTIKLEGLFKVAQYAGEEKRYCFVLRYGPGCCGNDGSAGFEVAWGRPRYDGPGSVKTLPPGPLYPKEDAWVEAVGILDTYEEDGYPYLFLDLFSLTEKEERGTEFVSQ